MVLSLGSSELSEFMESFKWAAKKVYPWFVYKNKKLKGFLLLINKSDFTSKNLVQKGSKGSKNLRTTAINEINFYYS